MSLQDIRVRPILRTTLGTWRIICKQFALSSRQTYYKPKTFWDLTKSHNKGKNTSYTPSNVSMNTCNDIPEDLIARHGDMTIAVDILYVNGIPFIMTVSRNIQTGTAELIKNKKVTTIVTAIS